MHKLESPSHRALDAPNGILPPKASVCEDAQVPHARISGRWRSLFRLLPSQAACHSESAPLDGRRRVSHHSNMEQPRSKRTLLGAKGHATRSKDATRNKCIASSNKCLTSNKDATRNKCLTSSNKKLVVTSATLLVTSALLVTRSY